VKKLKKKRVKTIKMHWPPSQKRVLGAWTTGQPAWVNSRRV